MLSNKVKTLIATVMIASSIAVIQPATVVHAEDTKIDVKKEVDSSIKEFYDTYQKAYKEFEEKLKGNENYLTKETEDIVIQIRSNKNTIEETYSKYEKDPSNEDVKRNLLTLKDTYLKIINKANEDLGKTKELSKEVKEKIDYLNKQLEELNKTKSDLNKLKSETKDEKKLLQISTLTKQLDELISNIKNVKDTVIDGTAKDIDTTIKKLDDSVKETQDSYKKVEGEKESPKGENSTEKTPLEQLQDSRDILNTKLKEADELLGKLPKDKKEDIDTIKKLKENIEERIKVADELIKAPVKEKTEEFLKDFDSSIKKMDEVMDKVRESNGIKKESIAGGANGISTNATGGKLPQTGMSTLQMAGIPTAGIVMGVAGYWIIKKRK